VRILVTHQLQFLQKANKILILKDGKCIAFGSFEELVNSGMDFISLLKEMKIKTEEENKGQTEEMEIKLRRLSRQISTNSSISSADVNSLLEEEPEPIAEKDEPKVIEETKMSGSINSSVYMAYIKAGAGCFLMFITFSSMIISQILFNGCDYWLTIWLVYKIYINISFKIRSINLIFHQDKSRG
jgi:ATP-binding cassette, subfamily C (CFTR/MRP), member 4